MNSDDLRPFLVGVFSLPSTMRIFSSAEYCRRVWRRIPSALVLPVFYPARISVSSSLLAATMNQKSSLREDPQFVSSALTGNIFVRNAVGRYCRQENCVERRGSHRAR
jgi:hypothetical protein